MVILLQRAEETLALFFEVLGEVGVSSSPLPPSGWERFVRLAVLLVPFANFCSTALKLRFTLRSSTATIICQQCLQIREFIRTSLCVFRSSLRR